MARRRKYQSADFVAGAYKKIALNKDGFNAPQLMQMRMAADRLALMDEIFKPDQILDPPPIPAETPLSAADQLLESMRKGDKNATA